MNFELPKIYPITDAHRTGLSHLEQVRRLVEGGATLIQLRDKTSSSYSTYQQVVECKSYVAPIGVRLIVNDRVDIALAAGADGVHLGQNDLPPAAARKLLGSEVLIGVSTHNEVQFLRALRDPVDYIAVGPIFRTRGKVDADPVVGLEFLRRMSAVSRGIPVVAIGGIGISNVQEVLRSGAASAAVIGAVLEDPKNITRSMEGMIRSAQAIT